MDRANGGDAIYMSFIIGLSQVLIAGHIIPEFRKGESGIVLASFIGGTNQDFSCAEFIAHDHQGSWEFVAIIAGPDTHGEAELLEVIDALNTFGFLLRLVKKARAG